MHFPTSEEELINAKSLWAAKYSFPNAIGAIDCSLFPIKKPANHGDEYICRKGWPAFNAQATCNADEIFTSFDCNWAGSVHDARIWRNSHIQGCIQENAVGALLLADEGYPLTPWTMTIFRRPIGHVQTGYNVLHKKERVIVERIFGQLKRRFPILDNTIRVRTDKIPELISACVVLFNVGKYLQDPDFGDDEERHYPDDPHQLEMVDNENDALYRRGMARRDIIAATIAGL